MIVEPTRWGSTSGQGAPEAGRSTVPHDDDETAADDQAPDKKLSHPSMGLPGPAVLLEQLTLAIARAGEQHREVAVIVVVDTGHTDDPAWGRLRAAATHLQHVLRPDDIVGQLDQGTLVAICSDVADADDAELLASQTMKDIGVSCTMAVTMSGETRDSFELLKQALETPPTMTTVKLPHGRAPLDLVARVPGPEKGQAGHPSLPESLRAPDTHP
jgi:hypothetical protein